MKGNVCFVGVHGDRVVVLKPQHHFTYEEALEFAAWLVVMAACTNPVKLATVDADFAKVKEEVENA